MVNKENTQTLLFCREEKGGCGKEIAIVWETHQYMYGNQVVTKPKKVAVHMNELNGREPLNVKYKATHRFRIAIEDKCALEREIKSRLIAA